MYKLAARTGVEKLFYRRAGPEISRLDWWLVKGPTTEIESVNSSLTERLVGPTLGKISARVVSLIALAFQTADPPVRELGRKPGTNVFRPRSKEHPKDETFPGLLIIQLEGRVFFVNAERIGEKNESACR